MLTLLRSFFNQTSSSTKNGHNGQMLCRFFFVGYGVSVLVKAVEHEQIQDFTHCSTEKAHKTTIWYLFQVVGI